MPDESRGRVYLRAADEQLEGTYEPPMPLPEYVDRALDNPTIAANAARYLLAAIESQGTRTVVERGEERRRYRFFDDPFNDGEHAVLGNTKPLNAFVDDLRTIAAGRGKDEKIVWIDGPTATGKSELKRCLVNGLREYSKTPEGRRYTLEWNISGAGGNERGLSYGEETENKDDDWYKSPVQIHPLSAFPRPVRTDLLADINDQSEYPISVDADLDPFSREAYDYLEKQYRSEGRAELFSAITDPEHLRVTNYIVDVGRGIGVLHAEDDGSPKERLVGSWMAGMLRELDSRGRKNPQAFSYDGVLSQGNGLVTIVEDASQHADLLRRLLNVPDERRVKLDKGIGMDLDTQLIVISNPDLDAELDQYADQNGSDPLKALKRRLTRHEFKYLTNRRLEAELIRRELLGETGVGDDTLAQAEDDAESDISASRQRNGSRRGPTSEQSSDSTSAASAAAPSSTNDGVRDSLRDAVRLDVRDERGRTHQRELAPHAIGAAATYSVVSRLDGDDLPPGISLVEKALLFEQGYIGDGDDRRDVSEFDFDGEDGQTGIPVTYTRDVIADLLQGDTDRSHPNLDVSGVRMPEDLLEAMMKGLKDAPVFSRAEAAEFENRLPAVREFIRSRQREDVLDAMLAHAGVTEATVAEYVEHVYAWDADEPVESSRSEEPIEPDPLKMKVFETEHLGRFSTADYDGDRPRSSVRDFRRQTVIRALTRYAWQNRGEGFSVADVDLAAIPELREVLEANDWDDVRRHFPDFDPHEWNDPPEGTETEQVKELTLDQMETQGYSRASAELTSRVVVRSIAEGW
ncbi:MAG: putative serine protein kinase, PrkA [uncultured archaeon A07HR60]|nr:MAG: putative serine protein kinase, PrkA [uncultured archaeon A07HR60]